MPLAAWLGVTTADMKLDSPLEGLPPTQSYLPPACLLSCLLGRLCGRAVRWWRQQGSGASGISCCLLSFSAYSLAACSLT